MLRLSLMVKKQKQFIPRNIEVVCEGLEFSEKVNPVKEFKQVVMHNEGSYKVA